MAAKSEDVTWNPGDETIVDEFPDPGVTINPRLTAVAAEQESGPSPSSPKGQAATTNDSWHEELDESVVGIWPQGLAALPKLDLTRGSTNHLNSDLHIKRILGKGGMGIVELADQRCLNRTVAIKRLNNRNSGPRGIGALLQEALITGSLEHPNIIPVHLLGQTDQAEPLLVMKRADGVPWSQLIRNDGHRIWDIWSGDHTERHIEILMQVCNAVHFAHTRGIIHRDIKPSNVMVGYFGEVYLLDWGVAFDTSAHPREDQRLWGTPAYMAPEMLKGNAQISPQTDVYLLGACLHETLTGRARHQAATSRDSFKLVRASASYHYPDSIPAPLAAICNKACAKDPFDRYDSAIALRDALARYLRERPSYELINVSTQRLSALKQLLETMLSAENSTFTPEHNFVIYKLFNESRFGFEQVLTQLPRHPIATACLQECLEQMFTYAIAQKNPTFAAALLADLPEERGALEAELGMLEDELTQETKALKKLEDIQRESDLTVSSIQRGMIYGTAVLVTAIFLALTQIDLSPSTPSTALFPSLSGVVLTTLVTGFISIWKRHIFLSNRANRSMMKILLTGFVAITINRTTGIFYEENLQRIFQHELMLLTTIATLVGFLFRRLFIIPALVFCGAFIVALLVPIISHLMLPICLFLLSVFIFWTSRSPR